MLPLQSAKKRIKNIQQELGFFMHYVYFLFFILGPAAELVVVAAVIMVVVVMLFLVVSIWKKFSVDSSG